MGAFDTFKYLLYTLRILRELEPSILVSLSLFSYATALWKARAGDSYTFSSLLPQRSLDLEKSAWHFAITKGETDPVTGEAWWQDVDAIDVYPNSAVYSGLSEWPTPKETWLDSSTDDLWCISYSAAASTHVPYGPIRSRDGTCGALPAQVTDWCNGWDTSMHVAGLDTFPTADAGWRCLTPDNWPPTHEGRCYAMCIDVVGDELHTPPHQSPDVFLFLSLPIMFDLYFILTWIHHKQLFKAFYGRLPLCRKLLFLLLSLCLVGAGTALSIFTPRVIGVYSQYDYPGPIAWIVICFGWAIYFFNLALEDDCKYIRYAMTPWIRLNMWMVGVKTVGDSGCKHPLDSDTALCFFLAKGYKSSFNNLKRLALAVLIIIVLIVLTFVERETSWAGEYAKYNGDFFQPGSFFVNQYIVLLLLAVKVSQSLKAPGIEVDYNVCNQMRALDDEPTLLSELKGLVRGSRLVVEREACHFVGDWTVANGKLQMKPTLKQSV